MEGSQATLSVDLEAAQFASEDEDIDMLGESAEAQLNDSFDFKLATNVEELKKICRTIFPRVPTISDTVQVAPGEGGDATEETGPQSEVVITEEPMELEEGQISGSSGGFAVPDVELVDSYDATAQGGDDKNPLRILRILARILL